MKIESIDHIVLTVKDINKTILFYQNLGMKKKTFGKGRIALHFGNQKINLHEHQNPIDPNVLHATPGSSDICLISSSAINEIMNFIKELEIELIEGPVERTGARGTLQSLYFYDPDENLIELSTYS